MKDIYGMTKSEHMALASFFEFILKSLHTSPVVFSLDRVQSRMTHMSSQHPYYILFEELERLLLNEYDYAISHPMHKTSDFIFKEVTDDLNICIRMASAL